MKNEILWILDPYDGLKYHNLHVFGRVTSPFLVKHPTRVVDHSSNQPLTWSTFEIFSTQCLSIESSGQVKAAIFTPRTPDITTVTQVFPMLVVWYTKDPSTFLKLMENQLAHVPLLIFVKLLIINLKCSSFYIFNWSMFLPLPRRLTKE